MGEILIRKLDDAVLRKLKARAKASGRSAESEAREMLKYAQRQDRQGDRQLHQEAPPRMA